MLLSPKLLGKRIELHLFELAGIASTLYCSKTAHSFSGDILGSMISKNTLQRIDI